MAFASSPVMVTPLGLSRLYSVSSLSVVTVYATRNSGTCKGGLHLKPISHAHGHQGVKSSDVASVGSSGACRLLMSCCRHVGQGLVRGADQGQILGPSAQMQCKT